MPVVGKGITSAIISAGSTLSGPEWFKIASAVGSGVAKWAVLKPNVTLQGVVGGTMGKGDPTGKFAISPSNKPVVSSVAGVSLIGLDSPKMAKAIGTGVATYINSAAMYKGSSTAFGSDTSKVVSTNAGSLIGILTAEFNAAGLGGNDYQTFASGLGSGIALMFLTGLGTGAAPGGSPVPGSGTSSSKLV